ncbi:MAG: peroxiredoxin [Candidatus Doudnabacteria bacterium]|nr:peroxiredoxin [Candidatus Doudnabacteria bacterium]
MLNAGTKAPEFTLLDDGLNKISLSDFAGKYVVVYFYPEDDTPGCTKEACAIRDFFGEFEKQGIVVLGISKDSPESHKKFKEKYHLPFTLLSDPERQVITGYGAAEGARNKRVSYVIDPHGIIVKTYPNVDPSSHAAEILNDFKSLQN